KFKVSIFSFFQTNTEGVKILYNEVKNRVGNPEGTILDLYSGVGTIGQVLSKNNRVIGIEIVEDAVKMAKENAKLNNLNCEFICGDVSQVVKDIKDKISFIVVDPPRAGIGLKSVKNICKFGVQNIVYVSCNPQTLCEDLKEFINNGYKVKNIQGVDMFPNTYHVECIVLMSKSEK
ncbi:Putative tRNA (Uracil-5-)-methyltransferase, partial [Candidatus Arthromitus sp. SFB-4]